MMFPVSSGAIRRLLVMLAVSAALPLAARAQSARASCRSCEPGDSAWSELRARQEKLALRFDSLRLEFERTARSDEEREALRNEMALILRSLQNAIAESGSRAPRAPTRKAYSEVEAVRVQSGQVSVRYKQAPTGYLGVSFEGVNYDSIRNNERVIRFFQYPRIALVEPASPAEAAGIRQGDTLLALNGMDVISAGEISLTKILVPDRRLDVGVLRGGDRRTLAVTVGRAPEYVVRRLSAPTVVYAPRVELVDPFRRSASASDPTPLAPRATSQSSGWVYSEGIGGARVETITEGLGRALGVESGVLVVRAAPGTPAHESGLRDGDVIQRVGGTAVSSTRSLRLALMGASGDAGVRLTIVRERQRREVTLRW